MLVLPYYELSSDPVVVFKSSVAAFGGWMQLRRRQVRIHTCVADWPAFVRSHPGLLQDGAHTGNNAESVWARWIVDQWEQCS